jgi:hypothetical protein
VSATATGSSSPGPAAPGDRSVLRSVGLPSEHGGWGLTAEPILLGLLLAPSWAGLALGMAAITAFLVRTPVKIALVDLRRGRHLDRTRVASRLAAGELLFLGSMIALAVMAAESPFWLPAVLAAPMVAVELWYDIRSRSRRLVPELAGAIGVASVAAMIVLAAGADVGPALGAWAILAARASTSIPYVRDQVRRLHRRPGDSRPLVAWDLLAVTIAVVAAFAAPELIGGTIAVTAVVLLQRLSAMRPASTAVVLGLRQTALGLAVVLATWVGTLAAGGLG